MKNPKTKNQSSVVHNVDMFAVSQNEMTGLLLKPPLSNYEMESYKSMFPFRADCDDVDHSTSYRGVMS